MNHQCIYGIIVEKTNTKILWCFSHRCVFVCVPYKDTEVTGTAGTPIYSPSRLPLVGAVGEMGAIGTFQISTRLRSA